MSKSVLGPAVDPSFLASWGRRLLGIACLGIGFLFAIGTLVDLDVILANHIDRWPVQVIIEMGIAAMLMVFGSWCLLRRVRSSL
jgi:hypothetical protein